MRKPAPSPPEPAPAPTPSPGWLRAASARPDPDTALFAAGAALSWLDSVARSDAPPRTLWRRRLALTAATAIAKLEARREDEPQLRDQWVLRDREQDPGPAGRRLQAFRLLGEARALRLGDWAERLPPLFDLAATPALCGALDAAAQAPSARDLPPRIAADRAAAVLALGAAHRGLALWVGDAVLARALGWARPLPLLPAHLPRAALRLEGGAWHAACATAWASAALAAGALHADLDRRAARLIAAAPRLRARDAAEVIEHLLAEDALAAGAGTKASDRAARRLFDRLVTLGLVRELTGRSSFRLYGL